MRIVASDYFFQVFNEYKKTFKEFMEYEEKDMPSDEVLLISLLNRQIESMKEFL